MIESLKKAQRLQPDFVVYTGDFISYENDTQIDELGIVMKEAVRGTKGTLAILGNHYYGHNWSQPNVANKVVKVLKDVGITTLRNEQHEVDGLHLIGIDDYWAINFQPEKVMVKIDANKANLVLCHNPDVCDLDIWQDYEGWFLSGHTHGGQVKPPFLNPPILPVQNKKYTAGEIALSGNRTLYINRALGNLLHLGCNVRLEITLFELTSA